MKRIFLAVFMLMPALNAYAVVGVAGEPEPFLKMGVGARATALSGAFCAYYDDATCPYWNPASIGAMKDIAVGSMFSWMAQDISHNFIDVILPVDFGVLAFNILNLSVGNIEGRTSDTPDYYTFSANDNSYFVTFAKQIVRGVCAGREPENNNEQYIHIRGRGRKHRRRRAFQAEQIFLPGRGAFGFFEQPVLEHGSAGAYPDLDEDRGAGRTAERADQNIRRGGTARGDRDDRKNRG